MQKETKIQENLFLRLKFIVFSAPLAVAKSFLKKKFLAVKTKNVYILKTNIFCFHDPSPKCLGDFLLSKTQKIRVFCHFWPLDGVEITQKHLFLIRNVKLPLFRHLNQNSTFSGI